jgi:hypothetical protein
MTWRPKKTKRIIELFLVCCAKNGLRDEICAGFSWNVLSISDINLIIFSSKTLR